MLALLDAYPALEDVLIGLAPPFKKLKNPVLRRSVAKVASLAHVAAVAGMPAYQLVNQLRAAVGQPAMPAEDPARGTEDYFSAQPEWFETGRVAASLDERNADPNKMPIASVLQRVARLRTAEILELITDFLPAPGIEAMRKKGFLVWCVREQENVVRTYFYKPGKA